MGSPPGVNRTGEPGPGRSTFWKLTRKVRGPSPGPSVQPVVRRPMQRGRPTGRIPLPFANVRERGRGGQACARARRPIARWRASARTAGPVRAPGPRKHAYCNRGAWAGRPRLHRPGLRPSVERWARWPVPSAGWPRASEAPQFTGLAERCARLRRAPLRRHGMEVLPERAVHRLRHLGRRRRGVVERWPRAGRARPEHLHAVLRDDLDAVAAAEATGTPSAGTGRPSAGPTRAASPARRPAVHEAGLPPRDTSCGAGLPRTSEHTGGCRPRRAVSRRPSGSGRAVQSRRVS